MSFSSRHTNHLHFHSDTGEAKISDVSVNVIIICIIPTQPKTFGLIKQFYKMV